MKKAVVKLLNGEITEIIIGGDIYPDKLPFSEHSVKDIRNAFTSGIPLQEDRVAVHVREGFYREVKK